MIGQFPWDPFPPSGEPDPKGPDPLHAIAFRAAVTSADAYHSVRLALRRESGALRVGNRFVTDGRYRQVAFLAFGNAANSMALGALHAIGDRLTQGFLAGPEPVAQEIPFRGVSVPPGWGGAREAQEAVAAATELSGELTEQDLLLVLLSGGAVRSLLCPPAGWSADEFGTFLSETYQRGATGAEVELLARVLGDGAVGGRLARSIPRADVATLIVDRGDGARLLGGGPMHSVGPTERVECQRVLERLEIPPTTAPPSGGVGPTGTALDSGVPDRIARPVVVASPGDALKAAADALFEKGWTSRLAFLALREPPAAAAGRFLSRAGELLAAEGLTVDSRTKGIGAFATTTLGLPEGIDEGPAFGEFVRASQAGLRRREMSVGLFRTAGAIGAPEFPAGAVVGAATDPEIRVPANRARVVRMRRGITDVGMLAVALFPTPKPKGRGAPSSDGPA